MKKLIIILALFLSYNTYAQYVPKAGNKLNVKPNGILVPTSTTDDTPIARAEIFNTGTSVLKSSTLPTASASVLGVVRVGTGLAIDGSGILSATGGGGGGSYTAGNGLTLTGSVFSADTSIVATNANTLSLAETFTRFGSGNFYPQPAVFTGGGTSTSDYFNIIGATGVSGTGALLMGTSPTMTTPTLGAATATTINKVTITAPTTNATLTLVQGSSLITAGAFSNTITTTANTTVTFPTTGTLYGTATGSITSANLLTSVSNETGTGVLVFGTSPTIATPNLTWAQSTKTAAYTAVLADYALFGDATTASFIITLPTASSASGKMYSFKKIDASANTVTIKGNGAELIDGTNTKVITTQYNGFTVVSNGTVWYVLL